MAVSSESSSAKRREMLYNGLDRKGIGQLYLSLSGTGQAQTVQ
jgi:hypothetical protein